MQYLLSVLFSFLQGSTAVISTHNPLVGPPQTPRAVHSKSKTALSRGNSLGSSCAKLQRKIEKG